MAGFEQWRWAEYLFRQALNLVRPRPRSGENAYEDRPELASSDAAGQTREQVASFYKAKIRQMERRQDWSVSRRRRCFLYVAASIVAVGIVVYLSAAMHRVPLWLAVVPAAAGVYAYAEARRSKHRERDCARLLDLYRDRLGRIQHQWMGKGDPGLDLQLPGHPSAADLDLFGEGSLFELLCDIQTPAGRETLAGWLQEPAKREEVISRQQSVCYLSGRADLRERLALVRVGNASEYSWITFRDWLTAGPVEFPRWTPWLALLLSISLVITGVCWWFGLWPASSAMWIMSAIAAAEAVLALSLRGRVMQTMEKLLLSARKLESMRLVCSIIESEKLETPGLLDLQYRLKGASKCVGQLQRLVLRFEARRNEWLFYFCRLLMWGTQWGIRIERWRQRHGRELMGWLKTLGAFEALMAIASYAYENPEDPNPKFEKNGPIFEAAGLGHPLMDPATCVRNEVKLSDETHFLMVTGSNMSGKSTLLRAVGLNATLAWMGAPVRATSLRLSQLQVCASIRVEDSLLHGLSHFYTEVQRLRAMLERADSGPPVLFLIDELFAGTNSADRRTAAEAVIRLLVERGSIGLVTSHDLALTEIAEKDGLAGANVHFSDVATAKGLSFDYLLRPGKLDHGNALKIIQMVGIQLK